MMHFETGRVAIEVEDCNQGGAEVGIGPTTLQVRPMVMTDRACTGAPTEVVAAIVAVLEGTIGHAIEAATLTLTNHDGKGLMLRAVQ